ncbi:hypothetical protein [Thermococcus sp.]
MYGPMAGHWFVPSTSIVGLVSYLIALFIAGLILSFSAKLVGIRDASVLRAMVGIIGGGILGGIAAMVVVLLFAWTGPFAAFLGFLAFLIVYVWTIKAVFNTGWLRAFVALVIAVVIEIVVLMVLSAIGLVAIGSLKIL